MPNDLVLELNNSKINFPILPGFPDESNRQFKHLRPFVWSSGKINSIKDIEVTLIEKTSQFYGLIRNIFITITNKAEEDHITYTLRTDGGIDLFHNEGAEEAINPPYTGRPVAIDTFWPFEMAFTPFNTVILKADVDNTILPNNSIRASIMGDYYTLLKGR